MPLGVNIRVVERKGKLSEGEEIIEALLVDGLCAFYKLVVNANCLIVCSDHSSFMTTVKGEPEDDEVVERRRLTLAGRDRAQMCRRRESGNGVFVDYDCGSPGAVPPLSLVDSLWPLAVENVELLPTFLTSKHIHELIRGQMADQERAGLGVPCRHGVIARN